jgi:hypothetical protein
MGVVMGVVMDGAMGMAVPMIVMRSVVGHVALSPTPWRNKR